MATLAYTTKQINREFKIKVEGCSFDGNKLNTLVGVSGLLKLIGIEMANKFLGRAFESGEDKTTCKLRRGLRIIFYVR